MLIKPVWNHFEYKEFECPCCKKNKTDLFFIHKLDVARDCTGIPFIITSGYRCEKHNKKVGGRDNSSHLVTAADIEVQRENKQVRFKIVRGLIQVGFNRIGVNHSFIHVDDDKNKTGELLWLY